MSANNLKIAFHTDRKALLVSLMKRAELVMADYEEWIVSGGTSIVLSATALEANAAVSSAEQGGQLMCSNEQNPSSIEMGCDE